MKKVSPNVLLTLLFIGNLMISNAQCLPDGIYFGDQASIDNFSTNYPGCTVIEGDVIIVDGFPFITNLDGLSQIEEIQGGLAILGSDHLTDLSGFDNLNTIWGDLLIRNNDNLINLHGLGNLTSVRDLQIQDNDNLNNISALNIMHIENAIAIISNSNLTSLNGLENITSMDYLLIENNDSLINLNGLNGFTTIYGIHISGNNSLLNLSGLNALTSVDYISISDNISLQTLNGLQSLTTVLNGSFYISRNYQLSDISNLSSLNMVNGNLGIVDNNILSLNGLEGLTAINGHLSIVSNTQLSSIEGIRNIDAETITNLIIIDNTNLSECAVQSVCDFLNLDPANATIERNATGCDTVQEVEAACALGTEENQISQIKIYPNPTKNTFEISGLKEGIIEIIDSQGRTVKQMVSNENNYSISELTSGIYFVKITSEKASVTKQLIKT